MDGIMVDNWFMEEVVADIREKKTRDSKYYAELLMAIVLWDEVYYPSNKYNWWNTIPSQVQNALKPLDDAQEEGRTKSAREFYRYKGAPEEYYWLKWKDPALLNTTDVIGTGALRYQALSQKHGLNYLPCLQRQEFLREYYRRNNIKTILARIELQKSLTRKVTEYLKQRYLSLLECPRIEFQMPALASFIFDNTPQDMSPIDFAFHLKNEGAVIRYRKYLQEIDDAIENSDWIELQYLLKQSDEAVQSVLSLDRDRIWKVLTTIIPRPSLSLNLVEGEFPSIEASFDVPVDQLLAGVSELAKNYRFTFLRDLIKYAMNTPPC